MIEHYSIHIDSACTDFMRRVLSEVAKNRNSFVIADTAELMTICFSASPEMAQHYSEEYRQGCSLSQSVAMIELRPNSIYRYPESGNVYSLPQLYETIRWVLINFPNYRVTDEETGEDVTGLVRAGPDVLFVPDWDRKPRQP